jgi:hypothetical protein
MILITISSMYCTHQTQPPNLQIIGHLWAGVSQSMFAPVNAYAAIPGHFWCDVTFVLPPVPIKIGPGRLLLGEAVVCL